MATSCASEEINSRKKGVGYKVEEEKGRAVEGTPSQLEGRREKERKLTEKVARSVRHRNAKKAEKREKVESK